MLNYNNLLKPLLIWVGLPLQCEKMGTYPHHLDPTRKCMWTGVPWRCHTGGEPQWWRLQQNGAWNARCQGAHEAHPTLQTWPSPDKGHADCSSLCPHRSPWVAPHPPPCTASPGQLPWCQVLVPHQLSELRQGLDRTRFQHWCTRQLYLQQHQRVSSWPIQKR